MMIKSNEKLPSPAVFNRDDKTDPIPWNGDSSGSPFRYGAPLKNLPGKKHSFTNIQKKIDSGLGIRNSESGHPKKPINDATRRRPSNYIIKNKGAAIKNRSQSEKENSYSQKKHPSEELPAAKTVVFAKEKAMLESQQRASSSATRPPTSKKIIQNNNKPNDTTKSLPEKAASKNQTKHLLKEQKSSEKDESNNQMPSDILSKETVLAITERRPRKQWIKRDKEYSHSDLCGQFYTNSWRTKYYSVFKKLGMPKEPQDKLSLSSTRPLLTTKPIIMNKKTKLSEKELLIHQDIPMQEETVPADTERRQRKQWVIPAKGYYSHSELFALFYTNTWKTPLHSLLGNIRRHSE